MRIPSQFNEDNLYRRGRRGNDSAHTSRRLIRLVVGLALVIVVMRQASRPEMYQTFFGPQASSTGGSADSVHDRAAITQQTGGSVAVTVDPESRRVAHQLTRELRPEEQRQWVFALSRWQSGRAVGQIPSSAPALLQRLASLEDLGETSRRSWDAMMEALMKNAMTDPPAATEPDHQPLVAAFLDALDDAAASRVVDGSVWRSGDFDAFYRYLDQADTHSGTNVATTGVLPLLQQPDVFRNQLVRVRGGVARAERIAAKENPYGITEYWQLWLRPSDGADRPMVVIVRTVPTLVAAVGTDAIVEEGPQVAIVGRFLKRLAYQSSLGADLAPVIVGRISVAPLSPQEVTDSKAGGANTASSRLWLTLAAAGLVGFALAMWRTSVMAKRARQLRTEYRREPDEFLRDLDVSAEQPADADPASEDGS